MDLWTSEIDIPNHWGVMQMYGTTESEVVALRELLLFKLKEN